MCLPVSHALFCPIAVQNECLANNGGCAQICVNILGYKGSHVCLCRTGYTKGADNVSCYGK